MPFSKEWFYGDTLFIIDPWVWLMLLVGLFYSARMEKAKRSRSTVPAQVALATVTLYIGAMAISGREARAIITREFAATGARAGDVMAGPVPLDPFVRRFVVEEDHRYRAGTFHWLKQPHIDASQVLEFPRGRTSHPAVTRAAETALGIRFLGWARYPTFEVQPLGSERFLVHIVDLRYARRPGEGFGAVSIPVVIPTAGLK
jgi:inner membrane protein